MNEKDETLDHIDMTRREFQAYLKNYRQAGYESGWDDCMRMWEDHMKRMNDALKKVKEPK